MLCFDIQGAESRDAGKYSPPHNRNHTASDANTAGVGRPAHYTASSLDSFIISRHTSVSAPLGVPLSPLDCFFFFHSGVWLADGLLLVRQALYH